MPSLKKRVNFGKKHIDVTDSTLVNKVFYDLKGNTLDAVFYNGNRYRYHGVTPTVFCEFVLSTSMGKFYNKRIKNRYPSEKVRIR